MATALACSNRSVRLPEIKGRELGKSKVLLSGRDLGFAERFGSKRLSTSHLSAIFLRSLKAMISAMSQSYATNLPVLLTHFPRKDHAPSPEIMRLTAAIQLHSHKGQGSCPALPG